MQLSSTNSLRHTARMSSPAKPPPLQPLRVSREPSAPSSPSGGRSSSSRFYATSSSKPFARSAAKRESVMALGSIQHLQHMYAKRAVLAQRRVTPSVEEQVDEHDEDELAMPPTPARPPVAQQRPRDGTPSRMLKSQKELRDDVLQGMTRLCDAWRLTVPTKPASESDAGDVTRRLSSMSLEEPASVEPASVVLDLINVTTAAVRRAQAYVASFPSDQHTFLDAKSTDDRFASLRRDTLALLAALKEIETRYRIADDEPDVEDTSEVESPGLFASPVDMTEQGHLYRSDVTVDDVLRDFGSAPVQRWLETVDRDLLRRGDAWSRSQRDQTLHEEEEEELPSWMTPSAHPSPGHHLADLLRAFLPDLPPPPSPDDRSAFLMSLQDGFALCHAYNRALRDSTRPFAFIPHSSIHALPSDPSSSSVGSTYRKIANLTAWAAALRLRYGLNSKGQAFDARAVAKCEGAGWQDSLERLACAWAAAVAGEKNSET